MIDRTLPPIIPAVWVEAAAEAMGPSRDCECTLDSDTCNVCYATVRAALSAVLPLMERTLKAEAWDEAHIEMHGSETVTCFCINPYREEA